MLSAGPKHDFEWIELREIIFHIQVSLIVSMSNSNNYIKLDPTKLYRRFENVKIQHQEEKLWTRPDRLKMELLTEAPGLCLIAYIVPSAV